mgnify:CR=1 FL=1
MAYTTIDDPTIYFNTKLFTGNGSTQSITGVGFQPDWVWFKNRSSSQNHRLFDAVRGAGKNIKSNGTQGEIDAGTGTDGQLRTFDSDGFSVGSDGSVNNSGENILAWNWKANGSGSSNTDGDITSTVSANTTAGFSIVKYTGNGTGGSTIGHGLGSVPATILLKPLDRTDNWRVFHKGIDATAPEDFHLKLQSGAARADANDVWNDTAPTSSLFTVGANAGVVASGEDFIAYCFAEKQGYSKFGKYVGNGNVDGTFVYTGFKPAWVLTKCSDTTRNWQIRDNKINPFNVTESFLEANGTVAEQTDPGFSSIDLLSNGFKHRGVGGDTNVSGSDYIFMAFAESPFVSSSGVPTTAR